MKTAVKKTKTIAAKATTGKKVQLSNVSEIKQETFSDAIPQSVNTDLIDFSPLNYRKYFSSEALAAFADTLKLHGIISPLTLRNMPSGRFELVAGERRLRAAKLAGLPSVPAMVRTLTDEEVTEIQLTENLQREDPHPMHEAFAVLRMQETGKGIEEIAARLGKSKTFVYSRIKLAGLIEVMQDIFLANKFTVQQAFEIADLAPESQYEFYEAYCTDWQKDDFRAGDLRYRLAQFRYDLKQAPFNTKDKKLVPEVGACTACPFNSATLKTLFPDMAKTAVCTDHLCYRNKCGTQLIANIRDALLQHQPQALIYNGSLNKNIEAAIETIPEAAALPRYSRYDISVFTAPQMPDKEDFLNDYEADESGDDENGFDEDGYNQAVQEYETDLTEYEQLQKDDSLLKGLVLGTKENTPLLFNPDRQAVGTDGSQTVVTAKEVQAAIKAGTVTAEILEAEAERLQTRETRSKELDREKVQLNLHTQFMEQFSEMREDQTLTDADKAAARLIVYQSLSWDVRYKVDATLFAGSAKANDASIFERLAGLSDAQFSYLIRMALAGKSESKYPRNETAVTLYKVAEAAGLDVQGIEQSQQEKATARKEKLDDRLADLERRKGKLKNVA